METGGVLLGYWIRPFQEAVMTNAVGPGPRGIHRKNRFVPDCEYQESEVARLYEESGRLHTYLGDWHTHPKRGTLLSRRDHRTLIQIASFRNARTPAPLMGILICEPDWALTIWQLVSEAGFMGPKWSIFPHEVHPF